MPNLLLKEYNAECTGPLDFPMKSEDAKDMENKLESGEYSPIKITKSDALEAFFDKEKADISIVTDGSIDKDGEIIDPNSINWDKFKNNGGCVPLNHDYYNPPVGKSIWQKKVSENVWKAKTQYVPKPENYPVEKEWYADTVFHLIKFGILKAKSIGGIAKYREPIQTDYDKFKITDTRSLKRISSAFIVYEYSVCLIGCNDNALVEAISKSHFPITKDFINVHFGHLQEKVAQFFQNKHDIEQVNIQNYITAEDYLEQQQLLIQNHVNSLTERIPKLVETSFKQLIGKVC
jgi:hypothetical protein